MVNNRELTDEIMANIEGITDEIMNISRQIDELITAPPLSYTNYPSSQRLVRDPQHLYTLPKDHAETSVSLEAYSVLQVKDAAYDRKGRLWLYVLVANSNSFQRPKRGWIPETLTTDYTNEELITTVLKRSSYPYVR